jgi:hypothetical protein
LQTSTEPAPKLFKQPTPAPPAMPGISASAPPNPTGGADATATEQPNELSSGGTPRQILQYGGGGPTLADCMSIWDPLTDMSKSEWKATCVRTMNGIDLPTEGTAGTAAQHHRHVPATAGGAPSQAGTQTTAEGYVQK